jgi:hypothetical protein
MICVIIGKTIVDDQDLTVFLMTRRQRKHRHQHSSREINWRKEGRHARPKQRIQQQKRPQPKKTVTQEDGIS